MYGPFLISMFLSDKAWWHRKCKPIGSWFCLFSMTLNFHLRCNMIEICSLSPKTNTYRKNKEYNKDWLKVSVDRWVVFQAWDYLFLDSICDDVDNDNNLSIEGGEDWSCHEVRKNWAGSVYWERSGQALVAELKINASLDILLDFHTQASPLIYTAKRTRGQMSSMRLRSQSAFFRFYFSK